MRPRLAHESRLCLAVLAGAAPALVAAAWWLLRDGATSLDWTLWSLAAVVALLAAGWSRSRAAWPLRTLANLLEGLREGDFSLRVRGARRGDALGELILEANSLAATLREQRLGALEATTLLRNVMAEIDVAVFTFDGERRLRLVNRAGERLLERPRERLLGATSTDLGLDDLLSGPAVRSFERAFAGGGGRWEARRSTFRQGGLPHQLLVVADLSRALREEERKAWQRLIRVLGHELNNSLAPISSIAGSLRKRLDAPVPLGSDDLDDLRRGLAIVGERAEGLARFIGSYSQLAKMPAPRLEPVEVGACVRAVVALDGRLAVKVVGGPDLAVPADRAQLQQLLINLVRNAIDAASESGGEVEVSWAAEDEALEIRVVDTGPGLANPANLFVPFFTTKPGGTGVGLVLCRQIAEAHGGSLELANRPDRRGCLAILRLPR